MTYAKVHNAIRKKFADFVAAQGSPPSVEYDNAKVTPPTAGLDYWVRFQILPAGSEVWETGVTTARTTGFVLLSIFVVAEKGDKVGLDFADLFVAEFKQSDITLSGARVDFRTPTVTPVGRSGAFWQINVRTPFWTNDA